MTQDPKQIERYRGIIKFLDNCVRNIALYPPEHPSVKGVSKRVFDYLGEIFEAKDDVLIGVINGVLYVDDYLFYETTPYSDNMLKVLTGFGPGQEVVELTSLLVFTKRIFRFMD